MTFEHCKATLVEIRRRQGTDHPLVQISCSGTLVRGRLTRTDTDRPRAATRALPTAFSSSSSPASSPAH